MLNVVFQRMEADSVAVTIKPIAVADVLGLPRGAGQDGGSMALAVQGRRRGVEARPQAPPPRLPPPAALLAAAAGRRLAPTPPPPSSPHPLNPPPRQNFLNTVVSGAISSPSLQNAEEVRASVAGAFEAGAKGPGAGLAERDPDSDDDKEHFRLARAGGGPDSPAAGAPGAAAAPPPPLLPPAKGRLPFSHLPAFLPPACLSPARLPFAGRGGELKVSVLQKDGFLVFRALCKLSIRTSDSATVSDPTAIRGKVRARCWAPGCWALGAGRGCAGRSAGAAGAAGVQGPGADGPALDG
jgi:hypothetical protein